MAVTGDPTTINEDLRVGRILGKAELNDFGTFETVAEISIAIIGFAGVIAVLGRSGLSETESRWRLIMLFLNGATALWGCLTPVMVAKFNVANPWLVAGMLYAPIVTFSNLYAYYRIFRFVKTGAVMPPAFYLITPIAIISLLYLWWSVLFKNAYIEAAQFLSVVVFVFLGMYHFYKLVSSVDFSANGDR